MKRKVTREEPARLAPRGEIPPYRLVHKLGEGGMGEVWLAEQSEPVRRRVAIKLIRSGMDTKHVIARFDAERQALALMDHPAIARVFDAGESPLGLPFFAMEYVAGEPITAYCDRMTLTHEARLRLFLQVCDGVQHAHQKGIIHRDLKPSNVLVTVQDDRPVPKIIDFGVAKATAQPLTDKTLFTELGALIGTPVYMSPEQARSALDIDTRSDVYALGVLNSETTNPSLILMTIPCLLISYLLIHKPMPGPYLRAGPASGNPWRCPVPASRTRSFGEMPIFMTFFACSLVRCSASQASSLSSPASSS